MNRAALLLLLATVGGGGAAPAAAGEHRLGGDAERQQVPAAAAPQAETDPTAGMPGPRGSSQRAAGEQRYDETGYAAVRAGETPAGGGVAARHPSLPADSYVEVTALDSGRTVLMLVDGRLESASGTLLELSPGAARELGVAGAVRAPVRVRLVSPTPFDRAALRAGRPATRRADAPPILLAALRKRLPEAVSVASQPARQPVTAPRTSAPRPAPKAAPAPAVGRLYVQVAAFSNARNAQALAERMGGFVKRGGGLHRVQLGPFATQREADAARVRAARAGYADARVFAVN